MADIDLNWDNTAVNASANATGQRASKRVKSVGGAYSTTGFTPANDLPKSANTVQATINDNVLYEFKIEALCAVGGPTINANGIQEGLVFACIEPSFVVTHNSIQVTLNLAGTDITKARIRIRKQTDDVSAGLQTVNNVAGSAVANFSGLDPATTYYAEIELYATVNGVEVISSAADQLNALCGGDVEGYQATTSAAPSCPAPADLVVGPLT